MLATIVSDGCRRPCCVGSLAAVACVSWSRRSALELACQTRVRWCAGCRTPSNNQPLSLITLCVRISPEDKWLAFLGFGLFTFFYSTLAFVFAKRRKFACKGRTCHTPRRTEGCILPLVA